MADDTLSGITMYDIRSDKSEKSLLGMVKDGLNSQPKTLPTLLLYDEQGLKLFEAITYLDEYYLTNAEIDTLEKHADAIAEHIPFGARVIELGSGNLRKVKILLDALERAKKEIDYFALDLSYPELKRTFSEVDTAKFKYVRFNGFHGTYDDGLAWLAKPEHKDRVNVVLSLGSSMGNFTREEAAQFLLGYSKTLCPADLVIIGLDATTDAKLVYKAYNDSEGVTEQFYRNGLTHANSLLGYEAFKQDEWQILGEYDEEENKHHAKYVALRDMVIADVQIKEGEKLPFEHSYKFTGQQSDDLWHAAGLVPKVVYSNANATHGLHVLRPAAEPFPSDPKQYAPAPVPSVDEWQQLWSVWDTVTRSMVPRKELQEKPIKLRNNLIFYLGHIPTFADIHFTKATGESPTQPKLFSIIFERGVDPDVDDPSQCHWHSEIPDEWPALGEILQYQLRVRNRILGSLRSGQATSDRKLARGLVLAFEHEAMHLETFLYMLLQSEKLRVPPGKQIPDFEALARSAALERKENKWHKIPEAAFEIGANDVENDLPPTRYFLWDCERPARQITVHKFEAQARPVSIGEYAMFLEQTHNNKLPISWTTSKGITNGATNGTTNGFTNGFTNGVKAASNGTHMTVSDAFLEGKAIRTVFGKVPLKLVLDWPVMASYDELAEYAKWSGERIPTADELRSIYHYVQTQKAMQKTQASLVPAVNGHLSNDGVEETPPARNLSNGFGTTAKSTPKSNDLFIDLQGANVGFKTWHPVAVTGDPDRLRGQSDTGGLWEWTSTPLATHDGFQPMALYPNYTADFFDDKHNICLGGSWATLPRVAGRKSFVNWYQRNYPYAWCTARLVRDAA